MAVIKVTNLEKSFNIYKKDPGFIGSLKSFFARTYHSKLAVDDVSFSVEEGELIGFIGPNGAGKTTTLKCLSGLLHPSAGEIQVLGYMPFARKNEFLKQISLVMGHKNQLRWDLPAADSFLLNKEIYGISDNRYKKVLNELASLLDIEDILHVQVRKLSLGQRMKCELIAALLHTPKILFLDEPTIGLDVVTQQKLREFIRVYNKEYNATILLTSHYMKDVEQLCERVIIIDSGKILYDGKLSNIVKKYATNKLITLHFNGPVPKDKLQKLGQVQDFSGDHAVLSVQREKSNMIAAKLLANFPVADLNIEEPNIEEGIKEVFTTRAS